MWIILGSAPYEKDMHAMSAVIHNQIALLDEYDRLRAAHPHHTMFIMKLVDRGLARRRDIYNAVRKPLGSPKQNRVN